jgi:hypothetical protein
MSLQPRLRVSVLRALAFGGSGLLGCDRDPEPEICPNVEPGELVISELRAEQSEQDSFGHFIEVYNGSGRSLDLQGLWVRQVALDGDQQGFFVRDSLELAAGGYAVIGPGLEDLPTWIDYGVGWDISGGDPAEGTYPRELIKASFPTGLFELEACDVLIDEVFYPPASLPAIGTLACTGADGLPSASENDDASMGCWCVDAEPSDVALPGIGLPGTPGRANRCP